MTAEEPMRIGQWFKKSGWFGVWQVVEVVGVGSSEGTVPVKVIAECGREEWADAIVAAQRERDRFREGMIAISALEQDAGVFAAIDIADAALDDVAAIAAGLAEEQARGKP